MKKQLHTNILICGVVRKLFFLFTLLNISMATAQTFTVNGVSYNVITGTTNVEITQGACPTGVLVIPATVVENAITYSVTSIGDFAFSNCTGLTSVVIPNSVTTIGLYSFNRCTSLSSVSIPNSIKSFEEGVFSGCDSLTSLTIPDSVISIGNFAFADCLDLTNVTFPNSVTSIGIFAFQFCSSLVSVTIPNSVTSIGNYAFTNCGNLTTINCDIVTPLVINANVFSNVNQAACALNVPAGSVSLYQAEAVWQGFTSINILSTNSFINKNNIKIYPNPVSNYLTIKNPSLANLQLQVINQMGQIVIDRGQNDSSKSLDVSTLSKGLYFLNINTEGNKIQTIKFIKN